MDIGSKLPVFFHHDQLNHKPVFEIAYGDKIPHPETTSRAESILAEIEGNPHDYQLIEPLSFPMSEIKKIHNAKMIKAFQAATSLPMNETFYPSVFPYYRDKSNLDPSNIKHAGAFCFDSGTPLNSTTYSAASWSAACAVEAAACVADGHKRVAYALCRPPGHHASKDLFGGYCYFNNAALAAKRLQKTFPKVAIVDIDFHHGNGTQVLFDRDPSVLVISIHGDPKHFYPYFTGFVSETGSGKGEGFNINIPLPAGITGLEYMTQLQSKVAKALKAYQPDALVLSAGFDTYVSDPIGSFCLETQDFSSIGGEFAKMGYPTVIVQEGGYDSINLGRNVRTLLDEFVGTN